MFLPERYHLYVRLCQEGVFRIDRLESLLSEVRLNFNPFLVV